MAVDVTSQLFKDIIKDINANATDVPSAIQILESTKYSIVDPQDVATYLAYSKLAPVSTTNPDGTPKTAKQPVSIMTILGIPTSIASLSGMMGGTPAQLAKIMPKIGTGFLAAVLQYEVFDKAVTDTENADNGTQGKGWNGTSIAMLGGLYFAAIAATMLWLSKLSKFDPKATAKAAADKLADMNSVMSVADPVAMLAKLTETVKLGKGIFTINPTLPHFWFTFAVAAAVTTLVLAMGVLIAKKGKDQAPATPQASVVNAFLKQIPPMTSLLPQNALVFLTAGATALGSSFSLSPGNMSNQFHTPTVQLVQELGGTTQDGAAMLGKVLVQQGLGPNGADLVTLVYPGADGYTSGITFALDTNGYIIGNQGPATNYLPFFQPVVDASGKVTGMKKNFGALQAILQIPACMTYANDTKMEARKRESALETCLRGNKDVKFIAMVGS